MPSVVDICNEAMDLLGAATITALTENSKEARLCNRRFATVRDATLRSHPWNCAIERAELAADSTAPSLVLPISLLYQQILFVCVFCHSLHQT
ncbi:MAG: hypothetical protein CM15mV123_200 [uncultured marine virus]|nr:MAG: hypothetical protein CM15mV123_200 [uncultured marine virus]